MQFGVFDHLDKSGVPLHEFYEQRLRLVEAYEQAGFYCYHTAEHHATPLGMAPSPSVLHAAIAQRTKRIRFGPLVYTLNLYHPLRLAEEICMLDHLSGGRFQLGIGRGISPHELQYFGADPALGQAMYVEAFQVILKALTRDVVDHEGEYYKYRNVPVELHPLQRPHPPLWYGIGNPESVPWCVANKVNAVTNAPASVMRTITDAFRAEWRRAGNDPAALPKLGTARHLVVAPTDDEAMAIARRAYPKWFASFIHLFRKHNTEPRFAAYTDDFDTVHGRGLILAGSPRTVRAGIERARDEAGVNYLLCRFAFGDATFDESRRSVDLFAREVMPAFA